MGSLNLPLEQEWFSNMKMGKKPTLLVLSFTAVASISASVGYGAWITGDMLEREGEINISKSSRIPVAYIGDTKYFTLDAALDAAYDNGKKDNIYVIPDLGMDLTISKDHEIEKGDSFLLPYEGENILDESGNAGTGFADNNPTKFRKTHVILDAEKKLDIKGNVSIGAITGSVSNPQGQASSSYCELTLGMNSTLNVEGKLNCYGFIKEGRSGSNILVKDGGVLTTAISFYDYTSATEMSGMIYKDVFPFKQFDLPSIRSKMILDYGSQLIGRAHLYGGNVGNMVGDAKIIGTADSFINMESDDAKIEWQFSDAYNDKTTNSNKKSDKHKTNVIFSGTGSFGSIIATLKYNDDTVASSLNSSKYYLPVPCGYFITIKNGSNFKVPSNIKGIKFMPGTSLTVEKNANLTLDSNVLFYQSKTSTSDSREFDYPTSDAAIFKNGGVTKVNAKFEGVVSICDDNGDGLTSNSLSFSSINKLLNTSNEDSSIAFSWLSGEIDDCKEKTGANENGYPVYSIFSWGGATGKIAKDDGNINQTIFDIGGIYQVSSNNDCWVKTGTLPIDISNVSMEYSGLTHVTVLDSTGSTEVEDRIEEKRNYSDAEKEGEFYLKANVSPSPYDSTNLTYTWSILKKSETTAKFKSGSEESNLSVVGEEMQFETTVPTITLITTKREETGNKSCYIKVKVNFDKADGTGRSYVESNEYEFKAKGKVSTCIPSSALILMADGTYKEAGLIRIGDMVLSFDHETGRLEPNVIVANLHLEEPSKDHQCVHLRFSNGASTDFIYAHGYFDTTLNKYVYIHADDYEKYIGHEFVYVSSKKEISRVKLVSASVNVLYTQAVSPITANSLNIIADNMLGLSSGMEGLFNIFEYDPITLAFDREKMQKDIDKYGLLGYEAFEKYMPKELYGLLPFKYLGVSLGKGLITWDLINYYFSKRKDEIRENMHRISTEFPNNQNK